MTGCGAVNPRTGMVCEWDKGDGKHRTSDGAGDWYDWTLALGVRESTETVLGLSDADTTEEKIGKLLALIPMAFEVLNEAQETIVRLKGGPDV